MPAGNVCPSGHPVPSPILGLVYALIVETTFPESTPILWPWYRNWPSPNYEVSIEHLRRVWHASRERLPFRTPGFAPPPPFKDLRMLQYLVRPVFRADWKTWHLYWRHFLVLWNRWKRNWMKLDRKQVLKLPLPIIRDWILLVCFSWRYEATEVLRVNFVMREALFEIYTWILCRFIPSWETNK